MRAINKIIIHCSYTKPDMDIGVAEIRDWHVNDNGWSDIGYHHVIRRDGTIEPGRDEARSGAHCKGHNHDSIGVCLVGGMSEDGKPECNYTLRQWRALDELIYDIQTRYPSATVHGHNEFSEKPCPVFNAGVLV